MYYDEDWKIKIIDKGYKLEREVYIFRKLPNGNIGMLGVGEIKEGDVLCKPTLELNPEQLQVFADALNEIGIKPQKGFLEGKVEAQSEHLKDLRKLLKL